MHVDQVALVVQIVTSSAAIFAHGTALCPVEDDGADGFKIIVIISGVIEVNLVAAAHTVVQVALIFLEIAAAVIRRKRVAAAIVVEVPGSIFRMTDGGEIDVGDERLIGGGYAAHLVKQVDHVAASTLVQVLLVHQPAVERVVVG